MKHFHVEQLSHQPLMELPTIDAFDLGGFFDEHSVNIDQQPMDQLSTQNQEQTANQEQIIYHEQIPDKVDFLLTLRTNAHQVLATYTSTVNAETFAIGATLTQGIFAGLGSLMSSCGVWCVHGLGSLAQASGSGIGNISNLGGAATSWGAGAAGLGGLGFSQFGFDNQGRFHLDASVDEVARATGISSHDLLRGAFSVDDVLQALFGCLSDGVTLAVGFGLLSGMIDVLFSPLAPRPSMAQN